MRAFHAVMVTGSIAAAADRLNLTQPAISKQLSGLEYGLALRLFNRQSGRATTPTPQGIAFFKAVEGTMAGLDDLETVAEAIRIGGRRRLRIAATPPLINSAPMMRALRAFRGRFADTVVSLEPRHRMEIEDWVATRQIDLALALLPANHPELSERPLARTQAVAVMHESLPLAAKPEITVADLAGEALILPSRQPLRTRVDSQLALRDLKVEATLESSSAITCCRIAAEGLGIALCDPFSPTAFAGAGLAVRPFRPAVPLVYGILLNRSALLDEALTCLKDLLGEAFTGKGSAGSE